MSIRTEAGRGQQLGRGQAHLVTHTVITGDGQAGLGGGTRVVSGELPGSGYRVVIGVVTDGSAGFLCD